MKTIVIEPKYVGFPLDTPTENNLNPDESPAELLDYDFSQTWYRFRESNEKIHDSGFFIEISEILEVTDDESFKNYLLSTLGLTEVS